MMIQETMQPLSVASQTMSDHWLGDRHSHPTTTIYSEQSRKTVMQRLSSFDSDPNDNYFDFTKSIDSSMSRRGLLPTRRRLALELYSLDWRCGR